MATFADKITQAIFDYRQLLRRHLKITERRAKIQALGLNETIDPTDEAELYRLAQSILADLKVSVSSSDAGYYTYSGMQKFAEHLQAILAEYELQDGRVIHKTQHASRALLHVIQSLMSSGAKLSATMHHKLAECGRVIANYGSHEQRQHYLSALKKYRDLDEMFFGRLMQEFEEIS